MNLNTIFNQVAAFLYGIITALVIGYIKDTIKTGSFWLVLLVLAVALTCTLAARKFRKPSVDVVIRNPKTITSESEAKQYARKVFIGFVPLFNGGRDLPQEEKETAIAKFDFDKFDIASSNLQPTIKAIVAHRSKLKHCWLISTDASLQYAQFLVEYLKRRENIRCKFHFGDPYKIAMEEDSQIINKTYDLVRRIFKEIPKNIKPSEIVTDITTGIRSMSLGTILACLDRERDIEFIGTKYDRNGFPDRKNPLHKPIIFSFDPQLQSNK